VPLTPGPARRRSRAVPAAAAGAKHVPAAPRRGLSRAPIRGEDATIAVVMARAIHEKEEWFGEGSAFASTEKLAAALQDLAAGRGEASSLAALLRGTRQPSSAESKVEEDPRSVIAAGGITPVYQPIVDLSDGRLVGVEAAARFGSGKPAQWFADAADAGLGGDLEISAALTALGGLAALSPRAYLSLKFSAATLLRPDAAALLRRAPLRRLVVEVGVRQPSLDLAGLSDLLRPLREGGLRVAIDAGGAGNLSLRQLALLAPDIVKIDIPTILAAGSAAPERALGRVVIAFAERTGTAIVGERIENQRDLPNLRYLGVRYGQGFLFAKPGALPVDEKPIVELIGTGVRRPIWARRLPPPWSPL
jgi:EAL domain-containing protein (putative c-di-GMP-specific phosphodiesterase class I)